jgi:hypothetical protein
MKIFLEKNPLGAIPSAKSTFLSKHLNLPCFVSQLALSRVHPEETQESDLQS